MIVGLTGSIGSGKTTIAEFFREGNFVVIDADKAGHEIMDNDEIIKIEVINFFGQEILDELGNIDRKKLGNIVFNDKNQLKKLNGLLHPEIIENIRVSIENYRDNGKNDILIEAPLLLETKTKELVDRIIVIKISKDNIFKRLKGKYPEDIIEKILDSQIPEDEKLQYADFIIDNDGTLEDAKRRVEEIIEKLK